MISFPSAFLTCEAEAGERPANLCEAVKGGRVCVCVLEGGAALTGNLLLNIRRATCVFLIKQ